MATSLPPQNFYSRFLTDDGLRTGNKQLTVDFSVTPGEWFHTIEEEVSINRMIIWMVDDKGISAEKYGNLPTLANGIEIKVKDVDGSVLLDLTEGLPIQSAACFPRYCHDWSPYTVGTGNDFMSARWTFEKYGSAGMYLSTGQRVAVEVSDDLSGLVAHTFLLEGVKV